MSVIERDHTMAFQVQLFLKCWAAKQGGRPVGGRITSFFRRAILKWHLSSCIFQGPFGAPARRPAEELWTGKQTVRRQACSAVCWKVLCKLSRIQRLEGRRSLCVGNIPPPPSRLKSIGITTAHLTLPPPKNNQIPSKTLGHYLEVLGRLYSGCPFLCKQCGRHDS